MTRALTTPAPKGPLPKNTLPSLPGIPITPVAVPETAAMIRAQAHRSDLAVFYLGRQPYRPVWELQRRLHAWRVAAEIPDLARRLAHARYSTLAKPADERPLLPRRRAEAVGVATDRGGDVTYHGPGQLVGYPIVDLRDHYPGVSWYLRGLEEMIICTLATFGLSAGRLDGLPGVWVRGRKVAALGVRLARWTTMHGFAINVNVPRRYLDGMIPCGNLEYGMVNLNDYLPEPASVAEVARRLIPWLQGFLGRGNGQISRFNLDPAT